MTDKPTDRTATSGEPEFLEAAKRRKKIPLWAIPLFPALLVWAIIYVNGVTNPPAPTNTPDSMGAAIYTKNCSTCHGVGGTGSATVPAFAGGDLLTVFTKWEDQIQWVNVGSADWKSVTGLTTFGDTKKPNVGGMPGFGPLSGGGLSCTDIVLVVRYEREHFAGAQPDEKLDALATEIAAGQTPAAIPNCKS